MCGWGGGGCHGDSNTPVVLTTRLPADWAELVEGERERERGNGGGEVSRQTDGGVHVFSPKQT